MVSKVWQALSEVLGTLHRLASFADVAIHEAIGNGLLRDALQEVGDAARHLTISQAKPCARSSSA